MGVLTGRTALVTGAGRGIGRGIAERLGRDGARVGVHYGRSEAAAKETVAAIEAAGGSAFAVGVELGAPGDAEALWAEFDRHADGLDILVNNAGIGSSRPIEQIDEAEYDRLFAVNVKAPFFIVKHGMTRLRDGGRVVNVSSGLARTAAMPHNMAYAMTKGALDVLSRDLSKVLGARGIRVNSVAPGIIDTDNTRRSCAGRTTAGRRPRRYRRSGRWGRRPRWPTWSRSWRRTPAAGSRGAGWTRREARCRERRASGRGAEGGREPWEEGAQLC